MNNNEKDQYLNDICILETEIKEVPDPPSKIKTNGSQSFCSSNSIQNPAFTYNEDHCGLFQVVYVILTQLTRFTSAWALFLMSFGIYNPGWRCSHEQPGINDNNDTNHQNISTNISLQLNDTLALQNASKSSYYYFHHGIDNSGLKSENGTISIYDNQCPVPTWCKDIEFDPDTVTIVTQFELICDKAHVPSIIISIQMVGMFFGSIIAGQAGESLGRKVSIYASTAVLSLSSGLAIFSPSWPVYSIFIFGIGFGGGGVLATFMVISTEFLGSKWRARFAAIPVSNIALGIFACLTYLCKNWIFLHGMTACVSSLALLGALWVPESLRWLRIHGTRKQTEKVLRKIAVVNKIPFKNKDITKAFIDGDISTEEKMNVKKSTICDLFKTYTIRILTIKLAVVFHCVQMSYYTIGFGVQALAGDFYTNFLISTLTEGPISLLVGPASNRLGRKWACSLFTGLSSTFCLAITVVYYTTSDEVSGLVIRVLTVLARAMIMCIVQTLSIFMIELFPTDVRSIAFGFISCFSRVGLIMAPFLIPTNKEFLPISFSCLGGALLLSILILLTLEETKNKTLVDITISHESNTEATDDSA